MRLLILLHIGSLQADEQCVNSDGVARCDADCNNALLKCQTDCGDDFNCVSACNRELVKCKDSCPCRAVDCLNGCPCANIYCSTFIVDIDGFGTVKGQEDEVHNEVVKFLGVPYAEVPQRFAASVMKKSLGEEIFDATRFGDGCIGSTLANWRSEDCLNVNVYLPKSYLLDPTQKLPVLINIHGGGFLTGSNRDGNLQPEQLVHENEMIVVQVNYRLAHFGFWYSGELDSNGNDGNWGLLDQQLALKWVSKYISSFNGDPEQVTITGCSAGGQSVILHTLLEDSWPLFKRAIAYSGPIGVPFYTREEAERIYTKVAKCLQCKSAGDLECLRGKTATQLADCTWSLRAIGTEDGPANISLRNRKVTQLAEMYGPVIGSKLLAGDINALIKSGQVKPNVELIINFASDEGEDFIESIFYPLGSESGVIPDRVNRVPRQTIERIFRFLYDKGDNTTVISDQLINEYSQCIENGASRENDECGDEAARWITDYMWACIGRDALNNYQESANIYYIEHSTPWPLEMTINPNGNRRQCHEKSCHCVSEYWLFGRYHRNDKISDDKELQYGVNFRRQNANFIKYGTKPDGLKLGIISTLLKKIRKIL